MDTLITAPSSRASCMCAMAASASEFSSNTMYAVPRFVRTAAVSGRSESCIEMTNNVYWSVNLALECGHRSQKSPGGAPDWCSWSIFLRRSGHDVRYMTSLYGSWYLPWGCVLRVTRWYSCFAFAFSFVQLDFDYGFDRAIEIHLWLGDESCRWGIGGHAAEKRSVIEVENVIEELQNGVGSSFLELALVVMT